MFDLKRLSPGSVQGAMAKVERYRLLNEPAEAESICRDILEIEPENEQVLIAMVLCLSDQIPEDPASAARALAAAGQLRDGYDRAYYSGIVWERKAKASYHGKGYVAKETVHDWLIRALKLFEEAEKLRAPGNDDALLRWNACVRFLRNHPDLTPQTSVEAQPVLSD